MNYSAALDYLYSLQRFGIKLGLRKTRALLAFAGNPERSFPSIHIAGTNGKGSTAAMIASILREAGYKVGLYTSPHLVRFNERIRIDSKEIDDNIVAKYTLQLKPVIEKLRCTFFEATTAIAFLHFADEEVDVAVVETGLGGRLDATNTLTPVLSIITNIGLEHTEHLGTTLSQIAREKAGIMKPGVPCLVGKMQPPAERTMLRVAESSRAKLISVQERARYEILQEGFLDLEMHLSTPRRSYKNLVVGMPGRFQADNVLLASLAVEKLSELNHPRLQVRPVHTRRGLKNIRRNTGLRGRLETIGYHPRIILDVAHNPEAVRQLVTALSSLEQKKLIIIFGVMKEKDYVEMIEQLGSISKNLIAVCPNTERAVESKVLTGIARQIGLSAVNGGTVATGIRKALKEAQGADGILITGSHYVVGEAVEILGKEKRKTRKA